MNYVTLVMVIVTTLWYPGGRAGAGEAGSRSATAAEAIHHRTVSQHNVDQWCVLLVRRITDPVLVKQEKITREKGEREDHIISLVSARSFRCLTGPPAGRSTQGRSE